MDTIILRTLQDSDKYGLEILNEIKNLSDDLYTVKQPTLYSSLKRLESQGLVLSCPGEETKGANRTYYRLTDEGRAFLEADQSQWEFARTIIDKLLSDKEFDKNAEKPFEPSDYRPLTKRTKKETEEKVVIKYVEIEKPIYIDKATGERIDGYSPSTAEPEEDFSDISSNFSVYNNQENTSSNYSSNDEISNQNIDSENTSLEDEISADQTTDTNDFEENVQYNIACNDINEENVVEEIEEENANYVTDAEESQEDTDLTSRSENEDTTTVTSHFTDNNYYDDDFAHQTNNIAPKPQPTINHNDYINSNIDYVGLIEDVLIEAEQQNRGKDVTPTTALFDERDGEITMADLQQALENKNITLKRYQKSNTVTYYSGKFFYSNKLLKDWAWITYAIYAIFVMMSYFLGKNVGIQLGYSVGFAVSGILFPIICTIIWGKSPLRKKRNNLTLTNAMLSALILVIAFMLVILIVAFFAVQIDIQNPTQYVPALVVPCCSLVLLPISVMIFALLFKVKSYHLK